MHCYIIIAEILKSGGEKYGETMWTKKVDHIRAILLQYEEKGFTVMFCFHLIPKWRGRLRYEGGRSWGGGVKAFCPRFQFVQTGCEGSSTADQDTHRGNKQRKTKKIGKLFNFDA